MKDQVGNMKKIFKKFMNQPINYLIVEAVVFLTMYQSIGNGLVNALAQEDLTYFIASLLGWGIQSSLLLLLVLFATFVIYILRKIWVRISKGNKKEGV